MVRRSVPSPANVLEQFFGCFESGDFAGAGALVARDAAISIFGADEAPVELRGLEEFLTWYSRRRELLGDSFEYRVEELLPGERHAVALITLSRVADGRRIEWRQVAVYDVGDGRITALRGYEEPQTRSGRW